MRLSIVTTLYRSEPYVEEFHRRASAAAGQITKEFEIVFVNDGSPDAALEAVTRIGAGDPRVRIIDLSRNFGHHRAMMVGLMEARGDLVFLLDSDLEEPPELLPQFYESLTRSGADVVYGVQQSRKGNWWERVSGAVFYRVFNALSSARVPENLITMRLMTARYVQSLVKHRDREVFLAGLMQITGFRQVPLPVLKLSKGTTTYNLARKLTLLVNAVTSFSAKPLVYVFFLGSAIFIVSTGAAVALVIRRVFFHVYLFGWPSLIVSIWMLGGLTIFCIGIVGMYVSKIFSEVKDRPYAIIRDSIDSQKSTGGTGHGR